MVIDLGNNYSYSSYEYENRMRIANLQLNLNNFELNLKIVEVITKTGIGASTKTSTIDNIMVGSLLNPNKGLIRSTLSKYKYSKYLTFPKDGWSYEDNYFKMNREYLNNLSNDNKII